MILSLYDSCIRSPPFVFDNTYKDEGHHNVAYAACMRYRPAQLVCAYLPGLSVVSCQIQLSRWYTSKIIFVSLYTEEIVSAEESRGIDVS